jgi:hypothetical protein
VRCSKTQFIEEGDHCYLEIERFDRSGNWGRIGYSNIGTLNAELVGGSASSWSDMAEGLHRNKLISQNSLTDCLRLDAFGALISNTDRHMGNLSFFFENLEIGELTPVYDMLPMAYMPRNGQIFSPSPEFMPPNANREKAWLWAFPIACEYWSALAGDKNLSAEFRNIAKTSLQTLKKLRESIILD